MQFLLFPLLVVYIPYSFAFFHLIVTFIIGRYVKIRRNELIAFAIIINLVSLIIFGTLAVDQYVVKPDFQIDSPSSYLSTIPLSDFINPGAYIYACLFLLGTFSFYTGRRIRSKFVYEPKSDHE